MSEYWIGIDYSLEKLTVVVSDCGKRPIAVFQALMKRSEKNKIAHYKIIVSHYEAESQFEDFRINKNHYIERPMSIEKIHFHRRIELMIEELVVFLKKYPRDRIRAITMEAYSKFSKNDAFTTGEGYGSIKTLLYLNGFHIDYFPPPKRPKKLVLGSGDLDKEAILYILKKEHGYDFLNDDMADAYLLSIYPFFAENSDLIKKIPIA